MACFQTMVDKSFEKSEIDDTTRKSVLNLKFKLKFQVKLGKVF